MSVVRTAAIMNIQKMLNLPEPSGDRPQHKDCLLMSPDVEDFSVGRGTPLLEVGVAILDTRSVMHLHPSFDDDATYFSFIKAYHFRFQESCHVPNRAPWLSSAYDQPDMFMYGKTEYIWREQVQEVFDKLLNIPDTATEGGLRAVHVVTHGGSHDLPNIGDFARPAFSFDVLLSHKTTEELQTTSKRAMRDIWAACNGQKPSLEKVLHHTGLGCLHQHNAGNDAVAQLCALIKLALMEWRQRNSAVVEDASDNDDQDGDDDHAPADEDADEDAAVNATDGAGAEEWFTGETAMKEYLENHTISDEDYEVGLQADDTQETRYDEQSSVTATPESLLRQVSGILRSLNTDLLVGTHSHCTRCGSNKHQCTDCKYKGHVECQRCLRRGHHITQHCGIRSDDLLEKKRRSNWEYYWMQDCKRGWEPQKYIKLEDTTLSSRDNIFESDVERCYRHLPTLALTTTSTTGTSPPLSSSPATSLETSANTVNNAPQDLNSSSTPPTRTWAQVARAPAPMQASNTPAVHAPPTTQLHVGRDSTRTYASAASNSQQSSHSQDRADSNDTSRTVNTRGRGHGQRGRGGRGRGC